MEVYVPRFGASVRVDSTRIAQVPAATASQTKVLVLCTDFDETHHCARGKACRFVHAFVDGLPLLPTHVNFAWRSLEECVYPRMAPGKRVPVAAPNSRATVDLIPSGALLQTRALDVSKRLTHCAHYYFNRSCRLGANCTFVHAVFVDESAAAFQHAPGPSQMPDRPQVLSKKQREALDASDGASTGLLTFMTSDSPRSLQNDHHSSCTPQSSSSMSLSSSLRDTPPLLTSSVAVVQREQNSPHQAPMIRRHNPYAAVVVETWSSSCCS